MVRPKCEFERKKAKEISLRVFKDQHSTQRCSFTNFQAAKISKNTKF
jgi:hypothetical protein